VNDSSDEGRVETGAEEAGERGWSRVKKDKGKGRQKDVSVYKEASGRQEIGNGEAMDMDSEEVNQLAEGSSHPSSSSQQKEKTRKLSMKPGTESGPTVNIGNSESVCAEAWPVFMGETLLARNVENTSKSVLVLLGIGRKIQEQK
jgi:hypothetical protein